MGTKLRVLSTFGYKHLQQTIILNYQKRYWSYQHQKSEHIRRRKKLQNTEVVLCVKQQLFEIVDLVAECSSYTAGLLFIIISYFLLVVLIVKYHSGDPAWCFIDLCLQGTQQDRTEKALPFFPPYSARMQIYYKCSVFCPTHRVVT